MRLLALTKGITGKPMTTKTRLLFNLSWGQKLLLVIVLTLVGLAVLTSVAFTGLNSVNTSFNLQKLTFDYHQSSLMLSNGLLESEAAASALNESNTRQFKTDLSRVQQLSEHIRQQSAQLNAPQLAEYANGLSELTNAYTGLRNEWLETGMILGFSTNEGKLAELTKALHKIEEISFSMIKKSVNDLIFTQSKYIVSKDSVNENKIHEIVTELEAVVIDMEWQDNVIGEAIATYRSAFEATRGLITRASLIDNELAAVTSNLTDLVKQQNAYLEDTLIGQVSAAATETKETALTVILVVAISVSLIIFISLSRVARQLSMQLQHTQDFLRRAAGGDFSLKLSTNNNQKDEFNRLRCASNEMSRDISRVISEVVDGNKSLLGIREELELAVEQLSMTGQQVEAKTQQSTEATQQISVAVNDVAKRSAEVSATAQSASTTTQTGRKVINDCASSMTRIAELIGSTHDEVIRLSASSKKMLGIVDVINDLADKTNLLALNAAIESARAGEAGRGFSVVADEVRALASKTVEATASIGEIIENVNGQSKRIGELMDAGIELTASGQQTAEDAMKSVESIDLSVQDVTSEMEQITVTVEQISHNADDIAAQVRQVFEQTEKTREMQMTLEEHTHQINNQAESLGKLTSRFRLAAD